MNVDKPSETAETVTAEGQGFYTTIEDGDLYEKKLDCHVTEAVWWFHP